MRFHIWSWDASSPRFQKRRKKGKKRKENFCSNFKTLSLPCSHMWITELCISFRFTRSIENQSIEKYVKYVWYKQVEHDIYVQSATSSSPYLKSQLWNVFLQIMQTISQTGNGNDVSSIGARDAGELSWAAQETESCMMFPKQINTDCKQEK